MKNSIRTAAVRLGRVPPFRFLFRLYYRAAWFLFSRLAKLLFSDIKSLTLHRGYASGDWEPGISDIDMVIELDDLLPGENVRFVRDWGRFYGVFRTFFPVIGEPIISSDAEAELYAAWGDARSLDLGKPAPQPADAAWAKTELDLWTEGLHAHTRLCKLAVAGSPVPAAITLREIRKSVLDVARHSSFAHALPPSRPVKSRKETGAGLRAIAGLPSEELEDILLRCDSSAPGGATAQLAQLACAHTANILERDAVRFLSRFSRFTAPAPGAQRYPAPQEEADAAFHTAERLKKRLGVFYDSALLDNMFSSAVALKRLPGPAEDIACCASILGSLSSWDPAVRGPLFLMGPKSLELMGLSAYDDDPLMMACTPGPNRSACLQSGDSAPYSHHQRHFFLSGSVSRLAPEGPLLDALYLESLSHFLRSWRGVLPPGQPGAIYAVSRAVSLWLYFARELAVPCFPLQHLLEVFKSEKGLDPVSRIFEAGLWKGLQPHDIENISALNAETLEAARTAAAELEKNAGRETTGATL
jgi:hypothetical protein